MKNRELITLFIHGVLLVVIPLSMFFIFDMNLSYFLSKQPFPQGYAIVIILYAFVVPFLTGIINYFLTKKFYDISDKGRGKGHVLELLTDFGVYGLFLTLIVLSYKTIFTYISLFLSIPLFPVFVLMLGVAGRYIREE